MQSKYATLSNGSVSQIAMTTKTSRVQVVNVTGSVAVYFRVDGTNPTVAGDNTYVLPAVAGASVTVDVDIDSLPVVKFIAAGTPVVGVLQDF